MILKENNSLLFIGDSITDCGRSYPVGRRNGLGCGYVCFVDSLLWAINPELKINILNTGISGNTIMALDA